MSDHSQLIFAHHEPGRGYCECEHCRKLPVETGIPATPPPATEAELATLRQQLADSEAARRMLQGALTVASLQLQGCADKFNYRYLRKAAEVALAAAGK